jgi:hypothetical protein
MVMAYPPLLLLTDEAAYRRHYVAKYCSGPLQTCDGISVWFKKGDFEHLFYESSNRDTVKDAFSALRAERMDWIQTALQDNTATLKQGWVKKLKAYDRCRRVAVVQGNYVVVIWINPANPKEGEFITAYVADTPNTLAKIMSSPSWP